MHHFFSPAHLPWLYLIFINLLAFALFGADKRRAKTARRRISERTLFLSALLGGSAGAILGMRCFRHKTLHKRFRYGLPLILAAQVLLCLYLFLGKGVHLHA